MPTRKLRYRPESKFALTPRKVGIASAVFLSVYGMVLAVQFFMYQTNLFRVEAIKITGNRYFSSEEIQTLAGVELNQPLFGVKMEPIVKNVLKNQYIRAVSVSRVLPSTLIIDVQEREPVFYLIDKSVYMVDETGIILKKLPQMPMQKLPVVTGLTVRELLRNRAPVYRALDLLRKIRSVDETLLTFVSEIHLSRGKWPELFLIKGGARVQLGDSHLYERLCLLSEFFRKSPILRQLKNIKRIDLTFKNRIIVERKS